jgi:amino acid transporter
MAAQIGEFDIIINEILNILPFLIPVIIIQWVLLILTLVLAIKNDVAYLPKWAWILIIILVNIIGPIIFLIIGRKKDSVYEKNDKDEDEKDWEQ